MILKCLIICLIFALSIAVDSTIWELFGSNVLYLTISNKTMWKLEMNHAPTSGGYPIWQWDYATQQWTLVAGACVTLSLETNYLYCVNAVQNLWRRGNVDTTSNWAMLNSTGYDMKVGSNNDIWFVSTNVTTGGYEIFKFDGPTWAITQIPGGALKVAPTPDNLAWIVKSDKTIQRWDGTTWITMPGSANDIIIGSDDLPLIVSNTPTDGGYEIMKWNATNSQWFTLDGIGGISLAVDSKSNPYVITDSYDVYRQKGQVSDFCPICKTDCTTCSDPATCKTCETTLCFANDTCVTCADGTYPSQPDESCLNCITNCAICTNGTVCETCQTGFVVESGQCVPCPSGEYYDQGACQACSINCAQCVNDTYCQACKSGYFFENNQCEICPLGSVEPGCTTGWKKRNNSSIDLIAAIIIGSTFIGFGSWCFLLRPLYKQKLTERKIHVLNEEAGTSRSQRENIGIDSEASMIGRKPNITINI